MKCWEHSPRVRPPQPDRTVAFRTSGASDGNGEGERDREKNVRQLMCWAKQRNLIKKLSFSLSLSPSLLCDRKLLTICTETLSWLDVIIRQHKWIADSMKTKMTDTGHDIGSIVWIPFNYEIQLSPHTHQLNTISIFIYIIMSGFRSNGEFESKNTNGSTNSELTRFDEHKLR